MYKQLERMYRIASPKSVHTDSETVVSRKEIDKIYAWGGLSRFFSAEKK